MPCKAITCDCAPSTYVSSGGNNDLVGPCKAIECCFDERYIWTSTQSYTATCPEGTTGDPYTATATAESTISQAAADALALAAAQAEAEAEIECTLIPTIEYPVCIYRCGGIGTVGALGCGIHEPAVGFLTEPGVIVIPGEGVMASNQYSSYEVIAFDANGVRVFYGVAQNNYDNTNVSITVDSADFELNFPCAPDTEDDWCGCNFAAPETPCDTTPPEDCCLYPVSELGPLYQYTDLPDTLNVNLPDLGWTVLTHNGYGSYTEDPYNEWELAYTASSGWVLKKNETDCIYRANCLVGDYLYYGGGCDILSNPLQIGCDSPCYTQSITVEDLWPGTLRLKVEAEFLETDADVIFESLERQGLCVWEGSSGEFFAHLEYDEENCYFDITFTKPGDPRVWGNLFHNPYQTSPVGWYSTIPEGSEGVGKVTEA